MKKINVGIFIFDEVEVLDFAGPFEVFSRTRLLKGAESEEVMIVHLLILLQCL